MVGKRLLVIGISALLGVVITYGLLLLIRLQQANVTPGYYGLQYFFLTALFIGAAVFVWVDHFMKTGMLPK